MRSSLSAALIVFAGFTAAIVSTQSHAACTTAASIMTCTVSTTNDTVDATGLPANAASLRDAIIQVNSIAPPPAGQTHVINLPASFVGTSFKVTLFKFLPPIWNDVTINGNGNTIEGNNAQRSGAGVDTRLLIVGSNADASGAAYFASGTRVKLTLNDLSLIEGTARGGKGAGGGLGAGGAIFVTGNGDVTVNNVAFRNNSAFGGQGASSQAGAADFTIAGGGMGGDSGASGAGGWGGNGALSSGGIGGNGTGVSNGTTKRRGAGGGGLHDALVGATSTLRGVNLAAAGAGSIVTNEGGTVPPMPGLTRGGGGGGGCILYNDPSSGIPADTYGVSGVTCASHNASEAARGFGVGGRANVITAFGFGIAGGGGGAGGSAASITAMAGGYASRAGNGGFGGGGAAFGGANFSQNIPDQGNGGFGGGGNNGGFGGGGIAQGGFGGGGKLAGFGGGSEGTAAFAGGGGGAGNAGGGGALGGAIFVNQGGTLTLRGNTSVSNGTVVGGAGRGFGAGGRACGEAIFVHGAQAITVSPAAGETVMLNDAVTDSDCAGNVSPLGNGGIIKNGAGALELSGNNRLGRTLNVLGGVLRISTGVGYTPPAISALVGGTRVEAANAEVFPNAVVAVNGAVLSPGLSRPGQLHAPGRLRLSLMALTSGVFSSGVLEINMGGITPGIDFSRIELVGGGPLDLTTPFGTKAALSVKFKPGYTPVVGDSFPIIDLDTSSVNGTFGGLAENATFAVGNVNLRINYNSNGAVRLTVIAAPTALPTLSLQSASNPAGLNQSFLLTANVGGASGAASGAVTFRDTNGNMLSGCEARPVAAGVATCNVSFATAGLRSLVADYSPDANATYRGASSSVLVQDVVNATPPGALSSIVTATGADVNGIGFITFTAGRPANDGGAPVTSYTASCTNTVTNQSLTTTFNVPSGTTPATATLNLTPATVGQTYTCNIYASNVAGNGPAVSGAATAFAVLNIDGSTAIGSVYDAATDGVMILRYMAGIRGDAISDGVIGATATRNAAQIATYLDNIKTQLDIDGDAVLNAATDGALIVRYMRLLRSPPASYILNVVNPGGTRKFEDDISFYLSQQMP